VGSSAETLLPNSLRKFCDPVKRSSSFQDITQSQWLNILAVVYGVIIFLIKLFHPSPISSYICPYLERKHGTVRCNPHRDLEPLRVLLCQYRIRDRDVPAARKDMEPLDRWRHCFDTNAPPMATGIFNIISDFAILGTFEMLAHIVSMWLPCFTTGSSNA
jgi:hypothetical protein